MDFTCQRQRHFRILIIPYQHVSGRRRRWRKLKYSEIPLPFHDEQEEIFSASANLHVQLRPRQLEQFSVEQVPFLRHHYGLPQ